MAENYPKQEGEEINKTYLKDNLDLFIARGFKRKCIDRHTTNPI